MTTLTYGLLAAVVALSIIALSHATLLVITGSIV